MHAAVKRTGGQAATDIPGDTGKPNRHMNLAIYDFALDIIGRATEYDSQSFDYCLYCGKVC